MTSVIPGRPSWVGHPVERTGDLRLAACLFAGLAVLATVRLAARPGPPPSPPTWVRAHRIDVNTAPAGELMALPGVGRVLAERIVAGREPAQYDALEDLARVHGIGPALLARVAPYVRFEALHRARPPNALRPSATRAR